MVVKKMYGNSQAKKIHIWDFSKDLKDFRMYEEYLHCHMKQLQYCQLPFLLQYCSLSIL